MSKWVVRNALITTSAGCSKGDLAINGASISEIGTRLSGEFEFELDAEERVLLPGLIDPHVHFELPVIQTIPQSSIAIP